METIAATLSSTSHGGADIPLRLIALVVFLLLIAGITNLILQRLRFPYTIGLVVVGLACSWLADQWALPLLPRVHLTENLIIYVFLPALIFDAALSLDVRRLAKNLVPILILAVPGVVFATVATGALIHWLTPLGWGPAMLFGALISTTDPVAVIAIFSELKAPKRLNMLVDGESLFNDATAIVIFGIVAGLIADGATPEASTLAWAAAQFVWVFVGGFAVGCLIGWIGGLLIRAGFSGYVSTGVLFSICVAYFSFIIAQGALGLSGVMAGVGAGMVIAYMIAKDGHDDSVKQIHDFWPIASFFGNSLIFLSLGLTERYLLDRNLLARSGIYMAIAALVVLAIRAIMVYGLTPLSNALPGQEPISRNYQTVMIWGGLRGALPIGLAVSILPQQLGYADPIQADEQYKLIILFTVAVVVFTLIVQGVTIPKLMAKLGLAGQD